MATPYARRQFAGGSIVTTVPLAIGTNDGSFTLAASTNWPDGSVGNFVIVLDFGNSTQEKVLCSTRSGLVITVAASGRGYDGTSAVQHNAGCTAQVVHCAQDDDEANQVVSAVLGQAGAAKGDILAMLSAAGPNTLTRVGIGATNQVLGVAAGLPAWQASPQTLMTTTGDILYASGANTPARLGIGSSGQFLQAGASNPQWATLPMQNIASSSAGGGSTTSASYGNLSSTSATVTLTTGTKALVVLSAQLNGGTSGDLYYVSFAVSGATTLAATDTYALIWQPGGNGIPIQMGITIPLGSGGAFSALTAGSNTFTVQSRVSGGTLTTGNCLITVMPLN